MSFHNVEIAEDSILMPSSLLGSCIINLNTTTLDGLHYLFLFRLRFWYGSPPTFRAI